MNVRKAFRYRVYPTAEQEARLEAWEHALRFLWNLAHEQRLLGLARPRDERRYYTAFDQQKELKELRAELPWLADVSRDVQAQLLVGLDLAWQRSFTKIARTPRWKKKGRDGVRICAPHPKSWRLENETVVFPKLGALRAVVHRPLEGIPKTCTLVRDGDQWFAALSCQVEVPVPVTPTGPPVALDRGIVNLVADSNGRFVPHPRWRNRQERRIARAARAVSRRKKGSRNQHKVKRRIARLFQKLRRQRDHLLHVASAHYAKSHGIVIVEKLQVRNMSRSAKGTREEPGRNVRSKAGLNRAILDSGWGRLVEFLRYKCAWAGGHLVEVPAAYSSQTCAACGAVDQQSRRSQSDFVCVLCRHRDHADRNAAKVLLSRGTHGAAVCGGSAEVRRPAKQKLRAARRGIRPKLGAFSSESPGL